MSKNVATLKYVSEVTRSLKVVPFDRPSIVTVPKTHLFEIFDL